MGHPGLHEAVTFEASRPLSLHLQKLSVQIRHNILKLAKPRCRVPHSIRGFLRIVWDNHDRHKLPQFISINTHLKDEIFVAFPTTFDRL